MPIIFDNGGSGSGGTGAGSVAKDMYFADTTARDTFTTDNPNRIYQGVTCAVVNGTAYDYFQWDDKATLWRDANLIFQGKDGTKGADGTDGRGIYLATIEGENLNLEYSDGTSQDVGKVVGRDGTNGKDGVVQELVAGDNITINSDDPARPVITSTGGGAGKDPSDGFDLKPDASIGLDSTSAVMIKNNAGNYHNAIDQDINFDAIRLGSQAMKTYLRTNEDHIQVQTTKGMKTIAHTDDIPPSVAPDRFSYWVREPSFTLTEEHIKKEILLMCEPLIHGLDNVKTTTIIFPDLTAFANNYYIPDINEADKDLKPHIENFRFSIWLYPFSGVTSDVKIILQSDSSWLPFVSNSSLDSKVGIYLYRKEGDKTLQDLHTFSFMRPLNYNPEIGIEGWSFHHVYEEKWVGVGEEPTPSTELQAAKNLTYINDSTGDLYVNLDRQVPVKTTDFSTSNFSLLRIKSENLSGIPTVEVVVPPTTASGFSFIMDGQPVISGKEILQVASGVYSFNETGIPQGTPVGTPVYVQPNGVIGLLTSFHVCGWVVEDGVVIDIDIYNASTLSDGYATSFDGLLNETTLAGSALIKATGNYFRKLQSTDLALNGIPLQNGVSGQSVTIAYKGVFRPTNISTFLGKTYGDLVVIDSATLRLQWLEDAADGSIVVGWYLDNNEFWIDCDMYNRFRDIARYSGGAGTLPTDPEFNSVTTSNLISNTPLTMHVETKDHIWSDTALDLAGSSITNLNPAVFDTDAATLGQVKERAGIKNSDSNTNLHGYLTMFDANDGSTVKSSLHTSSEITTLKSDVDTLKTNTTTNADSIVDLENITISNQNAINILDTKVDNNDSFVILKEIEDYTRLGITETQLTSLQGDVAGQAALFHGAKIDNDSNKKNYKLVQLVQIASDLHKFLPTDKGGSLVVTNKYTIEHGFDFTSFVFTDNDGRVFDAFMNNLGEFTQWVDVTEIPVVYDIADLGLSHATFQSLRENKEGICNYFLQGQVRGNYRWKLKHFVMDEFYGLVDYWDNIGILEVESMVLNTYDPNGNVTGTTRKLVFNYYQERRQTGETSFIKNHHMTSSWTKDQDLFEWFHIDDKIISLENSVASLEQQLDSAFEDFSLLYQDNLLSVTMRTFGGDSVTRSVTIVGGGGSVIPEEFDVYVGWDNSNALTSVELLNFDSARGKKSIASAKSTLLTDVFETTRTETGYLYSYIAYPKGAVTPDPFKVEYIQGQAATWNHYETVVNGVTYIVLQPEWANDITTISMKLVQ